jgi:hypothetical protein
MATYGGETPWIGYGLTLTVEAPTGTSSSVPVNEGDIFKIGGTAADGSGYKIVAAANADIGAGSSGTAVADSIWVQAMQSMQEVGPMTVAVIGPFQRVTRLPYVSGSAPTLGQSVKPSAANVRKVAGVAFTGQNIVLRVDTAALLVDVLH